MNVDELADIVIAHGFNVTLTGGDPLQNPNPSGLLRLVKRLKDEGLRIWCYTGYTYEELIQIKPLEKLIKEFEAIVEGPFIAAERDTDLRFRGSCNQRIMKPDGTLFPL